MNWIRERVLSGEVIPGAWCNTGSSITAEMAGLAGFEWVVIDTEHGAGDHESLVHQLQALGSSGAAPIVRIAWNEAPRFKRALDLGAAGVLVPYVSTAAEAAHAAAAMRYPPDGIRGVAGSPRATGYGRDFADYFRQANQNVLTVVQIETPAAVENAPEIAAVEGVDVLFVGPLDLSANLGVFRQTESPRFTDALDGVVAACREAGKVAGTLCLDLDRAPSMVERGFTLIAAAMDGRMVSEGMREALAFFEDQKGEQP
jgi:4-hydroxy-2-oxoheptanedioate aldolase